MSIDYALAQELKDAGFPQESPTCDEFAGGGWVGGVYIDTGDDDDDDLG